MASPSITYSATALVGTSSPAAIPVVSGVTNGAKVFAFVFFGWQTNTLPTSSSVTAPTGNGTWNLAYWNAFTDAADGSVVWMGWFEKDAIASDSGTYSFTAATVGGVSALLSGGFTCLVTGGKDPVFGDTLHASPTAMTTSSAAFTTFTPAQANCTLVSGIVSFGKVVTVTNPSGWTAGRNASGSSYGGVTTAYQQVGTPSATGALTFNTASGDYTAGLIATLLSPNTSGSGTATMTFTASAGATGAAAGTASMSFGGSGGGSAPSAGTAGMTFGATGGAAAGGTAASGQALLTFAGGISAQAVVGASALMTFAASGAGKAPTAGTASMTFGATGTGSGPTIPTISGETSRTTGTTSGGTAYTKVVGSLANADTGSPDGYVAYFPTNINHNIKLLFWNHPYSSPYDADIAGTGDSGWTFTLTQWLLDQGIAICSSNDAGDDFGSSKVMTAISNLYGAINTAMTVSKLIMYGESMGASAALNWSARHNTAPLVGVMTISGVCDTSLFSSYYSDYSAAYNPMLESASSWAGLPIFMESSASDTTVDETSNTNAFITHLGGVATVTKVEGTGNHLTSGNYPVSNMESWITGVMANNAAAGSASMSFSASGAGKAPSGGSASMTFGASGTATAPGVGSGSASLTFSAGASVKAIAAGVAALTVSAAASAKARGAGSASMTFTGLLHDTTVATMFWYDGTELQGVLLAGWYDGTTIQPVVLLGYWDGSSIVPL